MEPQSFTIKSRNGIQRVLTTGVGIALPSGNSTSAPTNVQPFQAIWDTGATGSVITAGVVQKLQLKPIGKITVNTAGGAHIQNQYLVDIILPNDVGIRNVKVTEATLAGCDVLIGMDIITLGDLSITNHDDHTIMSFRIPSCHVIDYVTEDHGAQEHRLKESPQRAPLNRAERRRLQQTGHL